MRILDEESDKSLNNILILLTPKEARALRGYLDILLESPPGKEHRHLEDEEFEREITIVVYTSPDPFNERIKKLILDDPW